MCSLGVLFIDRHTQFELLSATNLYHFFINSKFFKIKNICFTILSQVVI